MVAMPRRWKSFSKKCISSFTESRPQMTTTTGGFSTPSGLRK
jgi:hypothetical protein